MCAEITQMDRDDSEMTHFKIIKIVFEEYIHERNDVIVPNSVIFSTK